MLAGINVIDFTKGYWAEKNWQQLTENINEAFLLGFDKFRLWMHFNYTNTVRDEAGFLIMAPNFAEDVKLWSEEWPGQILFDWSWGYHGDQVKGSWMENQVTNAFGDQRNSWSMADSWSCDLADGNFDTLHDNWKKLLYELDDPRFTLSVGNELDGLLKSANSQLFNEEALHQILSSYDYPFTAGWRNEYSFDQTMIDSVGSTGPVRYSYYEKNEEWAGQAGSITESPTVLTENWGVSEFGINERENLEEAISVMQNKVVDFKEHGAQEVYLWAMGANDEYAWQVDNEKYMRSFILACHLDIFGEDAEFLNEEFSEDSEEPRAFTDLNDLDGYEVDDLGEKV